MPRTGAVAIFLPAVLQTYFSQLRHLWHNSLNTYLSAFFLEHWKGRWKEHQSSNRHIQVPTDAFWGCVGGFNEIMLQCCPSTGSKFTILRVLLTFLEVCKFFWQKGLYVTKREWTTAVVCSCLTINCWKWPGIKLISYVSKLYITSWTKYMTLCCIPRIMLRGLHF